ncbi:hypothetical protein MtrunA17_Chr2g0305091 [Medicago truncatula]|uniref:Uncharacterized protein n=1 Tax=Medicago truncatula TaxID=3880 RepID=A0A396JAF6_MEDTR|nr:hypothetical protein MtrunA17_Chr2g0305091 [Medicago truncatula]
MSALYCDNSSDDSVLLSARFRSRVIPLTSSFCDVSGCKWRKFCCRRFTALLSQFGADPAPAPVNGFFFLVCFTSATLRVENFGGKIVG